MIGPCVWSEIGEGSHQPRQANFTKCSLDFCSLLPLFTFKNAHLFGLTAEVGLTERFGEVGNAPGVSVRFLCSSPGSTPLPQIRPPAYISVGRGTTTLGVSMFTPPHVIPAKAGIQRHPASDLRGLYDDTRDPGSTCPSSRGHALPERNASCQAWF